MHYNNPSKIIVLCYTLTVSLTTLPLEMGCYKCNTFLSNSS